ncbi:MAG: hypothetical protein GF365_02840 [Candidatus Buchananbacteria bacterium]|nr:hypothetical protein [Candidatus Buchananbacteria bacterium]
MKKIFLILFFILINSILITGCTNQNSNNNNQPINTYPAANVDIQLKTDQEIYHSREKISLTVEILSDQNLNDVIITAQGITNSVNRSYFNQSKIINLQKNSRQQIKFSQILPNCNSCSGLRPGNYNINVSINKQGQNLGQNNILIKTQQ